MKKIFFALLVASLFVTGCAQVNAIIDETEKTIAETTGTSEAEAEAEIESEEDLANYPFAGTWKGVHSNRWLTIYRDSSVVECIPFDDNSPQHGKIEGDKILWEDGSKSVVNRSEDKITGVIRKSYYFGLRNGPAKRPHACSAY